MACIDDDENDNDNNNDYNDRIVNKLMFLNGYYTHAQIQERKYSEE